MYSLVFILSTLGGCMHRVSDAIEKQACFLLYRLRHEKNKHLVDAVMHLAQAQASLTLYQEEQDATCDVQEQLQKAMRRMIQTGQERARKEREEG